MPNPMYEQCVKRAMSKQVVTVDVHDTVHNALEIMLENRVHALPVINSQLHCVGLLSASDFVGVASDLEDGASVPDHESEVWWNLFVRNISRHTGEHSVMDLMSEDVISAGPDETLAVAAERMIREHVHQVPVLDADGRLLGILSTTDILRAMVKAGP